MVCVMPASVWIESTRTRRASLANEALQTFERSFVNEVSCFDWHERHQEDHAVKHSLDDSFLVMVLASWPRVAWPATLELQKEIMVAARKNVSAAAGPTFNMHTDKRQMWNWKCSLVYVLCHKRLTIPN